jgi:phosphate:Na+ symporter
MTIVFSFDLSWLSPLLIFAGVVVFVSRESTTAGRLGRVAIGLGLITLALQLIVGATQPLTDSPAVQALLAALPNEILLELLVGALLTVLAYSGLAIVLLTATLVASGMVPLPIGLGLVLGANLGSGILALLSTARSSANIETRQRAAGQPAVQARSACAVAMVPASACTLIAWLATLGTWRSARAGGDSSTCSFNVIAR